MLWAGELSICSTWDLTWLTHRLHSGSFLEFIFNLESYKVSPKKELLWSLWACLLQPNHDGVLEDPLEHGGCRQHAGMYEPWFRVDVSGLLQGTEYLQRKLQPAIS